MTELSEIRQEINRCSRCGGCQAVCPLFAATGQEPLVARGKLYLLKNYLDGKLELTPKMKQLLSLCLLCKACVFQCPNRIPVDQIVLKGRQEIAKEKGISFAKKNVFQHLLGNNGRLTGAARLGYLYQHSGLQWLIRKAHLLPGELGKKESLLPQVAWLPFRRQVPDHYPCPQSRWRVAYYTGCLTNYVYPETGHALVNVLRHQRVEIVIPEQWCCGIPALANGDEASAIKLARKNIAAFTKAGIDAIITDCASCGTMLQGFGDLVGTPEAKEFSRKVIDFSQFLDQAVTLQAGENPIRQVVTYHDPCHLKRGQGVSEAPRKLLRRLPGVTFTEMKDADRCCGAAGSFNLSYYDLSVKVGSRKAEAIMESGADLVVTGCPSCLMQIRHLLGLRHAPQQVVHLATLINESYHSRPMDKKTARGSN